MSRRDSRPALAYAASLAIRARRATARPAASATRVLIVGPSIRYLGGQAVQLQRLMDGLRASPEVEVGFLPSDPMLPRPLRIIERVPFLRSLVRTALYCVQLALTARRYDVVHVFSASYWSFLLAPAPALVVGRLLGCRVLLNYHSGEAEDHLSRWGWHALPLIRLADAVVVQTGFLSGLFARHGIATVEIPNHIDVTRVRHRERMGLRARFLSSRNFEPHYNVAAIVAAFAIVQAEAPDASLVIVGDGSLRRELEQQVRTLGLRRVRFTGPVPPSEMPQRYDECDVYVNASVVDNMPLSLLEAYAAGIPVVTSDAGGIPWIAQDEVTARVVPAGDVDALAAAMLHVLQHEGMALERASRARAFARAHFSWERVETAWLAVYGVRSRARSCSLGGAEGTAS